METIQFKPGVLVATQSCAIHLKQITYFCFRYYTLWCVYIYFTDDAVYGMFKKIDEYQP